MYKIYVAVNGNGNVNSAANERTGDIHAKSNIAYCETRDKIACIKHIRLVPPFEERKVDKYFLHVEKIVISLKNLLLVLKRMAIFTIRIVGSQFERIPINLLSKTVYKNDLIPLIKQLIVRLV